MPKPIIYLLLLITIGACNQKLDPKESIVCELTDKALICNKDDIQKLPKFEDFPKDSSLRPLTEQNPDGTFLFKKSIIASLIEPIISEQTKQKIKTDKSFKEGVEFLAKPLPLGKCTLHFLVLPPNTGQTILKIPNNYFDGVDTLPLGGYDPYEGLIDDLNGGYTKIFCREHFNLILENAKKYTNFISPNGIKWNKRAWADFPDYMTPTLRQDLTPQDKLFIDNGRTTSIRRFKIFFK